MDNICNEPSCREISHIEYRCKNHPEKRWFTKNIPGRSIFYNLKSDPNMGPECPCSFASLEHIHEGDAAATKWER